MSIAAGVTGMGRRQAEALMESTCTIRKVTGQSTNSSTGAVTDTTETVYTGKCRIRYRNQTVNPADSASQILTVQQLELSIPVTASGSGNVLVDHVATIDTNPLDTSMVGKTFRIAGVHAQTHATARRFPVEVVS